MTKKHFKELAEWINREWDDQKSKDKLIQFLGDFCQSQNARFDRDRWERACLGLDYRK